MIKLLAGALVAQALPRILDGLGDIWDDYYGDDFLKPPKGELELYEVEEDPLKLLPNNKRKEL